MAGIAGEQDPPRAGAPGDGQVRRPGIGDEDLHRDLAADEPRHQRLGRVASASFAG